MLPNEWNNRGWPAPTGQFKIKTIDLMQDNIVKVKVVLEDEAGFEWDCDHAMFRSEMNTPRSWPNETRAIYAIDYMRDGQHYGTFRVEALSQSDAVQYVSQFQYKKEPDDLLVRYIRKPTGDDNMIGVVLSDTSRW